MSTGLYLYLKFLNMLRYRDKNIRVAGVIGRVFLSIGLFVFFLACFSSDEKQILSGVLNTGLAGLLLFGAERRNRSILLIWIILTIFAIVIINILLLSFVPESADTYNFLGIEIRMVIIFLIGATTFSLWTVNIAVKARKEIEKIEKGEHLEPKKPTVILRHPMGNQKDFQKTSKNRAEKSNLHLEIRKYRKEKEMKNQASEEGVRNRTRTPLKQVTNVLGQGRKNQDLERPIESRKQRRLKSI